MHRVLQIDCNFVVTQTLNVRQNQHWMKERNKAVKLRGLMDTNESSKRRKQNSDEHEKNMSTAEEMEWNQFIVDSINNTEWLSNVVGV